MKRIRLQHVFFMSFLLSINLSVFSQNKVGVQGFVKDNLGYEVPYAAVSIPSKYIGTSTTEDGSFYLSLTSNNLEDFLEISSIGYLTYKIKVGDFLKLSDKTIVLEEDVVSLDEVMLLAPKAYVTNAIKSLKKNALSDRHQLNVLYRRFSTEAGKARFLVEHYIKVVDKGMSSAQYSRIEVTEGRKSADYRFLKISTRGIKLLIWQTPTPFEKASTKMIIRGLKLEILPTTERILLSLKAKGKKVFGGG